MAESRPRPAPLSTVVKTSINAFDIARAYVYGDRETQEKIETYGEHNRRFLRSLIRTDEP